MNQLLKGLDPKYAAKAVRTAVIAGLIVLGGAIADGSGVNGAEWVTIALAVLGSHQTTYWTENKTRSDDPGGE